MATRKSTGRTTPRKLHSVDAGAVDVNDLDAEFAGEDKALPVKRVRLFGRDWRLTGGPNVVAVSRMTDEDFDIAEHIVSYIDPAESADFRKELSDPSRSLDWPRLAKISQRLAEIVAERPTERS